MGVEKQEFRGAFDFGTASACAAALDALDDTWGERASFERLGRGVVTIDAVSMQPMRAWDGWNAALAELAELAMRGYVVASVEHIPDAFCHHRACGPEVAPEQPSDDRAWLELTPGARLDFEFRRDGGEVVEVTWPVVDEGDGQVSIRQLDDTSFNDVLGIGEVRQRGSVIDYVDQSGDQRWLDTVGAEGDAWLIDPSHADLLLIQQRLSDVEVSVGGETHPGRRVRLRTLDVPTTAAELAEPRKSTKGTELVLAHGVGIARIVCDGFGIFQRKLPKKPWWKLW